MAPQCGIASPRQGPQGWPARRRTVDEAFPATIASDDRHAPDAAVIGSQWEPRSLDVSSLRALTGGNHPPPCRRPALLANPPVDEITANSLAGRRTRVRTAPDRHAHPLLRTVGTKQRRRSSSRWRPSTPRGGESRERHRREGRHRRSTPQTPAIGRLDPALPSAGQNEAAAAVGRRRSHDDHLVGGGTIGWYSAAAPQRRRQIDGASPPPGSTCRPRRAVEARCGPSRSTSQAPAPISGWPPTDLATGCVGSTPTRSGDFELAADATGPDPPRTAGRPPIPGVDFNGVDTFVITALDSGLHVNLLDPFRGRAPRPAFW